MFKHPIIVTTFVAVVVVVFTSPIRSGTPVPVLAAAGQSHQYDAPPADAQRRTEPMMCHQMMGEMRAADAKLDQLVTEMNAASAEAKIAAMAQVVTELVRQRTAMHERMAGMDHCAMMMGRSTMKK